MNIVELATKDHLDDVPRDGHGKPLVIPHDGGKPKPLVRVTTFIDCIEDKSSLSDWQMRSVLVGAALNPSLLDGVLGMDPANSQDDKNELNQRCERAKDLAGANEKSKKGTHLHELSELVDEGKPLPPGTPHADVMDMAAYKLATVGFSVLMKELFVVVPELGVGGTFDRLLHFDGLDPDGNPAGNLIGDLKSGRIDYGQIKMPAQLAIYSRGKLYDYKRFPAPVRKDADGKDTAEWKTWKKTVIEPEAAAEAYTPLPEVNQNWGVVIHLPAGTGECELYWADLNHGWNNAELAKVIRASRSNKKGSLIPFSKSLSS